MYKTVNTRQFKASTRQPRATEWNEKGRTRGRSLQLAIRTTPLVAATPSSNSGCADHCFLNCSVIVKLWLLGKLLDVHVLCVLIWIFAFWCCCVLLCCF